MLPGVGIFGSGKLVNFLVSSLREKGFKIVGVWDINDEVAKESAERLSIPFFTSDIDTLVLRKEVQLIVICCPPHIHSQIVVKSFNVGKHVLSDWPIALNSQDVRQMVKAATYYPSLISVICQPFRFIRTFQLMRTLVTAENYVGDVTIVKAEISGNRLLDLGDRYSVKCDHYMGGGLLTNIGSHFIDIISFVTDLKAKSVHGILRTYSRETDHISMFRRTTVDTFCNFQMEMDTNNAQQQQQCPIASVTVNDHLNGKFNYELKVCGTKGYLVIRGDNLTGYRSRLEDNLSGGNGELLRQDDEQVTVEDNLTEGNEELLLQDDEQVTIINSKLTENIPKPYTQGMTKLIGALKNAFNTSNQESPIRAVNGDVIRSETDVHDNDNEDCVKSTKRDEVITDWFKDAVNVAANFEDGEYIQAVIDAIKSSAKSKQWVRVEYKLPFDSQLCKSCQNYSHSHPKINGM